MQNQRTYQSMYQSEYYAYRSLASQGQSGMTCGAEETCLCVRKWWTISFGLLAPCSPARKEKVSLHVPMAVISHSHSRELWLTNRKASSRPLLHMELDNTAHSPLTLHSKSSSLSLSLPSCFFFHTSHRLSSFLSTASSPSLPPLASSTDLPIPGLARRLPPSPQQNERSSSPYFLNQP